MTKQQFKKRWESSEDGGGITFDDIAKCAVNWGLFAKPKINPINAVLYEVLKTAETNDTEDYKPEEEEQ